MAIEAERGRRVALVIGNAVYKHAPRLANPQNDAEAVAASLERVGFTSVVCHHDLDLGRFAKALWEFRDKVEGSDIALIYFAGHGLEVGGVNYLIPVDAELRNAAAPRYQATPLDMVLDAVMGASRLQLIILDACRDNPFIERMRSSDVTRSVSASPGLVSIQPRGNMLVAYASMHGTPALDGDGKHSPYAEALLQFIEKPDLEIQFLFREVCDRVMNRTNNRQIPHIYGALGAQKIYLSPGQGEDSETTREAEVTFLKYNVERTDDIGLIEHWLEQFRHRAVMYARLAEQRLKVLIEADAKAWAAAEQAKAIEAYQQYLKDSPYGKFQKQANERIAELRDSQDWMAADRENTIAAYRSYIATWPNGRHADDASARIKAMGEDLDWALASRENSSAALNEFLRTWPSGRHWAEARELLTRLEEEQEWLRIEHSDRISDFDRFLEKFGNGPRALEAQARRQTLIKDKEQRQLLNEIKGSELWQGIEKTILRKRAPLDPEEAAWRKIEFSLDPDAFEAFVKDFPSGAHASIAESRAKRLRADLVEWTQAASSNTIESYEAFLVPARNSPFAIEAQARINKLRLMDEMTEPGRAFAKWAQSMFSALKKK